MRNRDKSDSTHALMGLGHSQHTVPACIDRTRWGKTAEAMHKTRLLSLSSDALAKYVVTGGQVGRNGVAFHAVSSCLSQDHCFYSWFTRDSSRPWNFLLNDVRRFDLSLVVQQNYITLIFLRILMRGCYIRRNCISLSPVLQIHFFATYSCLRKQDSPTLEIYIRSCLHQA